MLIFVRILDRLSFAGFLAAIVAFIGYWMFEDWQTMKVWAIVFFACLAVGIWTQMWFSLSKQDRL